MSAAPPGSDHRLDQNRPRATVIGATVDGWRRVWGAPGLVGGLVLVMAVAAETRWWPHGSSAWAPGAAVGTHVSWIFDLVPFGFGGIADAIVPLIVGTDPSLTMSADLGAWMGLTLEVLLWIVLFGGSIDRLARAQRVGARVFFGACGSLLWRTVRVSAILGGVAWLLRRWGWAAIYAAAQANADSDTAMRAVLHGFLAVTSIVALVGDYALVRMAVEDRRSALGAIAASWRFVWRRPVRVLALHLVNLTLVVVVLTIWRRLVPVAADLSAAALVTWLWIGLGLRVVTRLGVMAAEIAFFQGELAHAGYTALPMATWPHSPAIEAIERLDGQRRSRT